MDVQPIENTHSLNSTTKPWLSEEYYQKMYKLSAENPEGFWENAAQNITWTKKWNRVKNTQFSPNVDINWFEGAKLNACFNCVDRQAQANPKRMAFIWTPEDPNKASMGMNYVELLEEVCVFANVLKKLGVKKGDRVTIYLPMIPSAIISMLACARIGAVHSVIFGGFAADSIANRMNDCDSSFIITADEGRRGGKTIPLKKTVDEAITKVEKSVQCLLIRHTQAEVPFNQTCDHDYLTLKNEVETYCPCEEMDAEDPLFMLYTSGSTGKPKGLLHTTGGYMVYAAMTHKYVFDYHPEDVYWCAADVGWITGHTYMVYGPLANGATSVIYEGLPTYPDSKRLWQIVDQHKVNILYTAPTLIRSLMADGEESLSGTSRSSLRLLGSVGEPINPEAWHWYYDKAGKGKSPIVDTYWQTETGGIVITPLVSTPKLKPGAAQRPFFGINLALMDDSGNPITGEGEGRLCISDSWPGQARSIFGDHKRYEETYYSQYPGFYFTGDGARRDKDGEFWIQGRVDDVINMSGHRIGTAEVESSLVGHDSVAEAAVVGFPHDIKGTALYCYVTLMAHLEESDALKKELIELVKKDIGSFAKPEYIHFSAQLPKTRSGKIMRRILRKIASNDFKNLGDLSTLGNPEIVDHLIESRLNK